MAFQPPQRPQQHRPPPLLIADANATSAIQRLEEARPPEESQEWILFSPDDDRADNYASTASTTNRTARTGKAVTAQLSDLGSLDTAAVSSERGNEEEPNEDNDHDDNEDLDSLDDGLHAFNEPLSPTQQHHRIIEQSHDTVLPTHDGLGKFPGNSSPVQEQFWQHERFNPRRRRLSLRRSSLHKRAGAGSLEEQLAAAAAGQEQEQKSAEDDKFQRIEQWRMEQSKAIMEEIERETRRMKRRHQRSRTMSSSHASEYSNSTASGAQTTSSTTTSNHQAAETSNPSPSPPPGNESFWQRFTRKVIRDLLGFDDRTLALIFGESVASNHDTTSVADYVEQAEAEAETEAHDLALTRTESWEDRLLARIAKELGTLIHHISEHPGAFSTFLRTQEPLPYAGVSDALPTSGRPPSSSRSRGLNPPSTPHFAPTLSTSTRFQSQHRRRPSPSSTADPSLWGIEEEPVEASAYQQNNNIHPSSTPADKQASNLDIENEREYWEKDLDVKMVFKFLRNRISSPFSSSSTSQTPLNPLYHPAASSSSTISTGQHLHHSPLTPNLSYQYHSNNNNNSNSFTTAASSSSPHTSGTTPLPSRTYHYPAPTADTLRRAALIRQHHPLVSRNLSRSSSSAAGGAPAAAAAAATASAGVTGAGAGAGASAVRPATPTHSKVVAATSPLLSPILGQRRRSSEAGSCASQSTKRSKTARSGSISSRNYWDIGGAGAANEGGNLGGAAWSVGWGEV